MRTIFSTILATAVAWTALFWAMPAPVYAACDTPPGLPYLISGTLSLDGAVVPAVTITATVSGNGGADQKITGFTTDGNGDFAAALASCTGNGDPVTFAVDGYEIVEDATFQVGNTTPDELALSDSAATFTETVTVNQGAPITVTLANGAPGVVLEATDGDLGSTQVVVRANQDCTTVAEETVERCFGITPTTLTTATLTVYFYQDQIPSGASCSTLNLFHWNGSTWDGPLTLDASFGRGGRDCQPSPFAGPHAIRVTGVTDYSPFALKTSAPTAVTLTQFGAGKRDGSWGLLLWVVVLGGILGAGLSRGRGGSARSAGEEAELPQAQPRLPYQPPAILYSTTLEVQAGSLLTPYFLEDPLAEIE